MAQISPLAPERFPALAPVPGVALAAAVCGLRYQGRRDLTLIELAPGTAVAGVFTRSLTAAAPVDWCREALSSGVARAIVVNAGNANAFTGKAGMAAVKQTAKAAAGIIGCPQKHIFISSTGVIGETLDTDMITAALPVLHEGLGAENWQPAAEAIMTTDTFAKGASRSATIGGKTVTISGIAKGSGMIAPDMATMLGYVFTDAAIAQPALQKLLTASNQRSFNAITVDGDTSTSDTVLLCATGQAGHKKVRSATDRRLADFRKKLDEVMVELAQLIVRDGEGARKFITVNVAGAASAKAAHIIAMSIANSPLVKTAIAGEDANWGRVVMAVGKSGQKVDRDSLAISIGGLPITAEGKLAPDYDEASVTLHLKGREVEIGVDIGIGKGAATVWTCDLTHSYIDINADYRS